MPKLSAPPPSTAEKPARVLLNPLEAADVLGVSERTLHDLTAPRGPIPVVKVGRLTRYRPAALEAWAAALESTGADADADDDKAP